ncbi:hypothetical protein M433DRAFT_159682 [Acidomyces richmondensis BFW]|nr:hypothetical protein M433DRAFT_159682 [Acidomyces richmondensis BFW]
MSNLGMHRTPTPSEAGGSTRPRLDNNSASKVAKPDFYCGDRYKLGDWLNQMNLYFLFNDITRNKTLFATTEDEEGIFADFKQFSRVIESIFGIYNSKEVAIRIIQHLT